MMPWRKSLILGLSLCLLASSGWAQDQSEGTGDSSQVTQASQDSASEPQVRETTIYIPYDRLRKLFEKEGRGVYLPYEKYRELWDAARRATVTPVEAAMPARSVVSRVDSRASIEGDAVVVRSEVTIELLAKGWHEVPLGLAGATVRSGTLDGEPARLVSADDGSQRLLIHHDVDQPRTLNLQLEYAAVPQRLPGLNQVTFHPPRAPIHRWRIVLPEVGTEITMVPDVSVRRVEESSNAASLEEATTGEGAEPVTQPETPPVAQDAEEVEAFVGAAETVGFSWTAKAEGAAGLAALVTVSATQEVSIEEGVVRTRNTLAYDISRADVDRLTLEVPTEHDVVNVFDPNVRRWEKTVVDGVQRVEVLLFQPTRGAQNLVIDLERFVGGREMMSTMVQTEIHAPVVKAIEAAAGEMTVAIGRQQGLVVAKLATSLRGEVIARSGLLQIDTTQLPAALSGSTWDFAYRYVGVPYDLGLRVEKVAPEITTQEWVEVRLTPTLLSSRGVAAIDVARAGIFQLEWEIPAGFEVKRVEGIAIEGGEAAAIDSHELKPGSGGEAPGRLVIALARQALGRIGILVEIERKLDVPALLTPTEGDLELVMPLPRVATSTTLKSSGELVVQAAESLRLDARRTVGVRPGTGDATLGPMPAATSLTPMRFVGRWSFDRERVDLVYAASRRRPYVEARQTLEVDIQEGTARYQTTLAFDVRYSGVESIRVDVPIEIASKLVNVDDQLQDRPLEPQPGDVATGYVAWELTADDELLGEQQVSFTWDMPLGDLPVGRGVDIPVPVLKLPSVDRFWGQIVARKAESIEMGTTGSPSGLRPIDPRSELISGMDPSGVARAFEFQGDWSLTLQATRYELEEVKRTSIEAALVRAVVTRSDRIAIQAIYRMRSARQRIAIELPGVDPADSGSALDAQPLKVAGKNVALERDETRFYIPFLGHSAEEAVIVELRYNLPLSGTIQVPEFPEDPAIQRVDLWVYLPDDRIVIGQSGPWSRPEFRGWGWNRDLPAEDASVWERIRGPEPPTVMVDDFPVDGVRHAFTTLRPERGVASGLRLRTVNRAGWDIGVVVMLAIAGLILAWRPLHERFLAISVVVISILAAGVWEPWTLASFLRTTTLIAVSAILSLWVLKGCFGLLRGLVSRFSYRPAAIAIAANIPIETSALAMASPASSETGGARESQPNDSGTSATVSEAGQSVTSADSSNQGLGRDDTASPPESGNAGESEGRKE